MIRSLPVTLALLAALPAWARAPATVPAERATESVDSPEFAAWLPVERTGAESEVLVALGWRAVSDCCLLRLTGSEAELLRVAPDGTRTVAQSDTAGLPPVGRSAEVEVRRRGPELIVGIGDRTLLHCLVEEPLDGRAGAWATTGARLEGLMIQPLGEIALDEDFFEVKSVPGRWDTLRGSWEVGVYWDPLQERDHRPIGASWYQPGEGDCLAAAGHVFWDSYRLEATARIPQGAGGPAFHVMGSDDFCALELDAAGALRLVQVVNRERRVLAEAPVKVRPDWWYRLGVEVSTGLAECFLNDQLIIRGELSPALSGRIGLWADGAVQSRFDDVSVRSIHVVRVPEQATAEEALQFKEGSWQIEEGAVHGRVAAGEVAALRGGSFRDMRVSARVEATRNATAGVVASHVSGQHAMLFTVTASDQPTWHLHAAQSGETTKLAEGPAPAAGGEMTLTCCGGLVECALGGTVVHRSYHTPQMLGRCGVYLQGGRATFTGLMCKALDDSPQAVLCEADGANTPVPALEQKRMLRPIGSRWIPVGGSWRCASYQEGQAILASPGGDEPAQLRYHAQVPGDLRVIADMADVADGAQISLGVHADNASGYCLRVSSDGSAQLLRGEQVVEEAVAGQPLSASRVELKCDGAWLVGRVGEEALIAWRDRAPLQCGRPEVTVTGGQAVIRRLTLASDSARVYRFDRVEPDWQPATGAWSDHTGMACILWDYWMTGDGREEPALTWNRHRLDGDVTLEVSVSEFTEGHESGHHQHFPYHDIRLALAGKPGQPDSGYVFIAGADGGRRTVLLRRGQEVASTDDRRFRIVMGGHCNSPRAVRLQARRAGAELSLTFNGVEALCWEDPQPLGGGHVGLGCEDCRANFRDCVLHEAAAPPS
ncbi:MAG: hypothetical protein U9R79_21905 [Armatimonadota bacterium]|nr:hypothetical protein [Armatimonadota bacterium]